MHRRKFLDVRVAGNFLARARKRGKWKGKLENLCAARGWVGPVHDSLVPLASAPRFNHFSGPKQSHSLVNPVHCLSKLSWSANASLCGFGKNHTTSIDFQSTPSAHWTKRVGCLGQNRASLFSLLRSLFPSLISSSLIFVSGKFSSPL